LEKSIKVSESKIKLFLSLLSYFNYCEYCKIISIMKLKQWWNASKLTKCLMIELWLLKVSIMANFFYKKLLLSSYSIFLIIQLMLTISIVEKRKTGEHLAAKVVDLFSTYLFNFIRKKLSNIRNTLCFSGKVNSFIS
jgi:hypothetical protein